MFEFNDDNVDEFMAEVEVQTTMACAIALALTPKDYQIWYTFNAMCQAAIGAMALAEEEDDLNLMDRAKTFMEAVTSWVSDLFSQTAVSETIDLGPAFHSFVRANIGWTFETNKKILKMLGEQQ